MSSRSSSRGELEGGERTKPRYRYRLQDERFSLATLESTLENEEKERLTSKIRVLNKLVEREKGVVGLDNGVGDLRIRDEDGENEILSAATSPSPSRNKNGMSNSPWAKAKPRR